LRRRKSWAAAACLFITLGLAMPSPAPWWTAQEVGGPLLASGVASRAEFFLRQDFERGVWNGNTGGLAKGGGVFVPNASERAESDRLSEMHQIVHLNRLGVHYGERGELDRAEPILAQANTLCQKKLGPTHPTTRYVVKNLAAVYQVALEQPEPAPATTMVPCLGAEGPSSTASPSPPAVAPPPEGQDGRGGPRGEWRKLPPAHVVRDRIVSCPPREVRQTVVPVLAQAFQQACSAEERIALARALGELGPAAWETVPQLTHALRTTSDPAEKQAIVLALGQMGPAARPAIPTLRDCLASREAATRQSAQQALLHLGPVARDLTCCDESDKPRGPDRQAHFLTSQRQRPEVSVGIRDTADCFRLRTLREAHARIQDLARTQQIEVLVETVPAPPEQVQQRAQALVERMGARSLHVLIVRNPPSVHLTASPTLQQQLPLESWQLELARNTQASRTDEGLLHLLSRLADQPRK